MAASDGSDDQIPLQCLHPTADLWTSVEIRGDRAIYRVRTSNVLYHDRLAHMGFTAAEEGQFVRALSAVGDVKRTHANFARHLEDILLHSGRCRSVGWQEALAVFSRRVAGTELRWFLYGSGALAVRGIDVEPGDLDFCVDDARLAGAIFEDLLIEPVTPMTDWVADYTGRAFAGCIIEWIADVHPDVDNPAPHEHGRVAATRLERVRWHGYDIPVAPLDLQLAVAQRRGLTDRVTKIHAHMTRT